MCIQLVSRDHQEDCVCTLFQSRFFGRPTMTMFFAIFAHWIVLKWDTEYPSFVTRPLWISKPACYWENDQPCGLSVLTTSPAHETILLLQLDSCPAQGLIFKARLSNRVWKIHCGCHHNYGRNHPTVQKIQLQHINPTQIGDKEHCGSTLWQPTSNQKYTFIGDISSWYAIFAVYASIHKFCDNCCW